MMPLGAQMAGLMGASGASAGASYDTDAQAYFDALLVETITPSDAQKLAISNYYEALKADSNYTKIKALYLPIWADADANALNAVNPGTYDLSWGGTVTHATGYIEGNGTTGYASAGFRGPAGSPTFVGLTDASFSANILTGSTENTYDSLYGWYLEAAIFPCSNVTTNARGYIWRQNADQTAHFANSGVPGLWTMNTATPTGVNTNKFNFYKDSSLLASSEGSTGHIYSTTRDWFLLAMSDNLGPSYPCQFKVNFAHAGEEFTSFSDFQTDTATLLAAL